MGGIELLEQEIGSEAHEASPPGAGERVREAAATSFGRSALEAWSWVVDPEDTEAPADPAGPPPWSTPFIRAFAWARVLGA
jgi:hypothetical protein